MSAHYTKHKIQPIDAMQEWLSPDEYKGFLRGNIIKYVARYKDKGGVKDLEKARYYLNELIRVEA